MPLPTETIVSEQATSPEREVRHELFNAGQWTLMVSYYGPSSKYGTDGAYLDLAAWAWIDGAKCRMEFGLPLPAMQAVYEALGKVLPDEYGDDDVARATGGVQTAGAAWADLQSETEAIDGDQVL